MRLSHSLLIAVAVTSCAPTTGETEAGLASAAQPFQLACGDPRGCPDLISSEFWLTAGMVIDTRTFEPSSCAVHEDDIQPGKRRLLRTSSAFANLGVGELIVGAPSDHPELYNFDECHGHLHFRDFDHLRLWWPEDYAEWVALREAYPSITPAELLDAHPALQQRVVQGLKRHICMSEYFHCEPAFSCPEGQTIEPSTHPLLDPSTCATNQGISVGWIDVYPVWLDGQWVEAPNPGGTFILEHEINGTRVFEESDYTNNSSAVCVNIPPKNGAPFVGDPTCIDPPVFDGASDCAVCLEMCGAMVAAGAIQDQCTCSPFFCGAPPAPPP
jgi:hypothetical protein